MSTQSGETEMSAKHRGVAGHPPHLGMLDEVIDAV